MADDSALTEIAHRLYGLPLGEFIAARNAAAKDAVGDVSRAVKGFKKSAAGAHLVNLLVREDDDLLDEIRDLGSRLRSAQAESDAAGLRSLDQERRALVGRSVTAAASVAESEGTKATDASLRDVEQTVWAALVDAGAFATMRAGTLLRPLSPNGFGSVDLEGASAVDVDVEAVESARPPARSKAAKDDGDELRARREAKAAAQREVDEAQAELDAADDAVTAASDAISHSEQRIADLKEELAELRERISEVERSLTEERDAQSARRADLRAAEKARRTATTAAERARRRQGDV